MFISHLFCTHISIPFIISRGWGERRWAGDKREAGAPVHLAHGATVSGGLMNEPALSFWQQRWLAERTSQPPYALLGYFFPTSWIQKGRGQVSKEEVCRRWEQCVWTESSLVAHSCSGYTLHWPNFFLLPQCHLLLSDGICKKKSLVSSRLTTENRKQIWATYLLLHRPSRILGRNELCLFISLRSMD